MKKIIYLDHASTSFPRHPLVIEAMVRCMRESCANPGRSGHSLSLEAARIVYDCREKLAKLFNVQDSSRIVFTANATEAINTVLFGILGAGCHVITTSMEHNAMMRPLRYLEKTRSVEITVLQCDGKGFLDPLLLPGAIRKNTALIAVNHVSNVTGTIQDIRTLGQKKGSVPLLVDCAQSAGALPVDVAADGIDFLAFTGHKSLLGPTGTGGLYMAPSMTIPPLRFGGTGSLSEKEDMPDFLPDRFESGTNNIIGIAGLAKGLEILHDEGIEAVREREAALLSRLLEGLSEIPSLRIYGPCDPARQAAVVSLAMEGFSVSDISSLLDRCYGIMTRGGLQCAPVSHRTLGTFPEGTVRISMGHSTVREEVDCLLHALRQIAEDKDL